MSDYWRRATAVPYTTGAGSPYASQMHVVVPPGLNASQLHNPHLDTTLHPYASSPPHAHHASNQSREAVMYEYDEARRTYLGILQRERVELDNAKHEVDALSYEKATLRKNLSEAELRAAAAARERDIANAKVIADTAALRAQVSQTNSESLSLKDELNRVQHAYTSTLLERSQYEAIVASLRAEVLAAGKTIVEQTGTIRALSQEMSRRDPYHLIKERREQGGEIAATHAAHAASAAEASKYQATIAGLEDQVKKLIAEKAVLEAKSREESASAKSALDSKVAVAAEAFRTTEAALRTQLKALESDMARVRQAAIDAAEDADKKDLELRALKIKSESDRQLAADLGRQLAELKKGTSFASPTTDPKKAINPNVQLDEERKRYETKIAEGLNAIRDASQQVRAAYTVITQLETGTLPADVKDAALVDVSVTIISGEKLLDRDPKNKGLLDPFVRLFDVIGDKILETDPCVDTTAPKFIGAKSSGTTRVNRNGKGSLRLEVWARVGPNDPEQFLGMAFISSASVIDGGNTQRSVTLQPRADEAEQVIVQNAKALGSITFGVDLRVAGAKAANQSRGLAAQQPGSPAGAPNGAAAAVQKPATPAAVIAQPAATQPTPTVQQPTPPPVAKPVEAPKPVAREQPKTDAAQNVLFQIFGCDRVIHRDTLNSKSDPYVTISRAGSKEVLFKTSVKSSTDAPRWLPDSSSTTTIAVTRLQPDPFVFQVWDDDVDEDDFLGEAKLSVADILSGSGQRTLELCPRDNEPDKTIAGLRGQLGTITVSLLIASATSTQDKPATATNVAPDGTTLKPTAEEIKTVSTGPAQKMLIYVPKCTGLLKNPGTFSNTDPYVEILGPQGESKSTPVIAKSENPTWSLAEASMQAIIAPSDDSYYTFTVLDDDKIAGVGSIRFCGQVQLTCNEMLALGEGSHTLPLKPRKNETESEIKKNATKLGTITIQLSRIYAQPGVSTPAGVVAPGGVVAASAPAGTATAAAAAAAAQLPVEVDDFREVVITVLEAKDVLSRNMFKGSDIYVVVNSVDGKEKHRTLVRDNTTHATWSETEGRVTMLLSPSAQRDQFITFDAYDKETVGSDHYLGHLKIPVPRLFQLNGQSRTEKWTSNPAKKDSKVDEAKPGTLGTVTFKVSISGMTSDVMSSMMVGDIANRRAAPSTTAPFKAKIWVKGCNKLRNRQVNGEISDPYVVIKDTQGVEHQVPTKDNDLDPKWTVVEGSLMTTINPKDAAGVLSFDVRDIGYKSGLKPMGSARLLIKDLIKEGFGERTLLLGPGPKENDSYIIENDGKLGTVTIDVTPDDGAATAAAPVAAAAAGGSANALAVYAAGTNSVPCTIRLLSGEQLLKRRTTSSPLVEAYDSSNQLLFTTPTIATNLNPVWSGQPNTSVVATLSPLDAGELLFKIFDDNANSRGAMGVARVSVKSLFVGASTRFTLQVMPSATENDPLVLSNKGSLGSLQIEVTPVAAPAAAASATAATKPAVAGAPAAAAAAAPTAAAAPVAPAPAAPRRIPILIKVKSAKDLRVGDFRSSDPVVRIFKNDEQFFQSDCIDSSLNPVWENAKASVNLTIPSTEKLTFQVLDQDKVPFMNPTYDDLGSAVLTVEQVMSKLGVDQELPLALKGQVKGSLIVNFSQE